MRRILFVVGLAAGYVIGARAGRPAFDAVVDRVQAITGDDRVHRVGEKAKQALEEQLPTFADVAEKAASAAAGAASAAKDAGDRVDSETAPEPASPGSAS